MSQRIDLRSDTVTKPSAGMIAAMNAAKVGDDVFEEDPSVNELEAMCATLFGKEAAIFCPTGTMTNQIAIKLHTSPGDEIICERESHVYIYEGGGIAFNSGCQVRTVEGERGKITANDVLKSINAVDIHKPPTTLVSLENTCNRGGGACYELETLQQIQAVCKEKNLGIHLDGARIFNAIVAKNYTAKEVGDCFDTISICLSKGLGTPLGSVLVGTKKHITKARRYRKMLGGGMRQAGYMAACGIFALNEQVERLAEDHQHAKQVASVLIEKSFVGHIFPVETNIIIFEVMDSYTADELVVRFANDDVLCFAISPTYIRFVFHIDITPEMVQHLIKVINSI